MTWLAFPVREWVDALVTGDSMPPNWDCSNIARYFWVERSGTALMKYEGWGLVDKVDD